MLSLSAPSQGTDGYLSFSTPTQRGTTPIECWYSPAVNQTAYSTASFTVDFLRLQPFVIGRAGYLDRIAFEVTTVGGAGSKARACLYRATSKYNIYPNDLVVDGGEFACDAATGVKSTTINVFVTPGLYWAGITTGTAAPTVRTGVVGNCAPVLGSLNTIGATLISTVSLARAYAALPATCPAGGSLSFTAAGLVHVRFAS